MLTGWKPNIVKISVAFKLICSQMKTYASFFVETVRAVLKIYLKM
jgi:hypothetical protein